MTNKPVAKTPDSKWLEWIQSQHWVWGRNQYPEFEYRIKNSELQAFGNSQGLTVYTVPPTNQGEYSNKAEPCDKCGEENAPNSVNASAWLEQFRKDAAEQTPDVREALRKVVMCGSCLYIESGDCPVEQNPACKQCDDLMDRIYSKVIQPLIEAANAERDEYWKDKITTYITSDVRKVSKEISNETTKR